MKLYTVKLTNNDKSRITKITVVVSNEIEAKKEALATMRQPEEYTPEIVEVTNNSVYSYAEDLLARIGFISSEWELRDGKSE